MANRLSPKSKDFTKQLRAGRNRNDDYFNYKASQFEYELKLILESIGEFLKNARDLRGLSQEDLAKLMKTKPAQISRIESGTTDLKISTLLRIGTTFNICPDRILPDLNELKRFAILRGGYGIIRKGDGLLTGLSKHKNIANERLDTIKLFQNDLN